MNGFELLGKQAVAKTASYPRYVQGKGKVIAYCDAPTVTIEREDGTQFTWRADLCEFLEEVERANWNDRTNVERI